MLAQSKCVKCGGTLWLAFMLLCTAAIVNFLCVLDNARPEGEKLTNIQEDKAIEWMFKPTCHCFYESRQIFADSQQKDWTWFTPNVMASRLQPH